MLRSLILLWWAGMIFLFTCTKSMEQLIQQGIIAFDWSSQPVWFEFWYPLPSTPDGVFIQRKIGHAVSFFIFTILLYYSFLSRKKMIVIGLFYAAATEVLQLYFQRGGRLFDIGFDGIGIVAAILIVSTLELINERNLTGDSHT